MPKRARAYARRAAKAESGVAFRGVRFSGPTRRGGDGGRSFRVNSSERFRGEEAESASPQERYAQACGPRPGVYTRAVTTAPSYISRPFHTKPVPPISAGRSGRARHSPAPTRANSQTDLPGGAPHHVSARAAHQIQETVSHRCRKR